MTEVKESEVLNLFCRCSVGTQAFALEAGDPAPEAVIRALSDSSAEGRPPCVFVHAFPLDSRMWEGALGVAAGAGHPALAFDLPGFGRSPAPEPFPEALEIRAAARAVSDCLDALSIEEAVLVGCSMGGYVIFAMLRDRPGCAAGLMLVDTRATADTDAARSGRFEAVQAIRSGRRAEFLAGMKERLLAPGRAASDDVLSGLLEEIFADQKDEVLAAALMGLAARDDSSDLLGSLTVPTTVLVGEHDALVPVDEARAMASAIPGAVFEVVPGAGHLPNLEAPHHFEGAIVDLLERVRTT